VVDRSIRRARVLTENQTAMATMMAGGRSSAIDFRRVPECLLQRLFNERSDSRQGGYLSLS